jgi:casein kinase 1
VAELLQGLAQLKINNSDNRENLARPVLGDRKNVQDNDRSPAIPIKKGDVTELIVITNRSLSLRGEQGPAAHRYNKAARITKLTQAAGQATDNRALARIMADFVKVLQSSSSRTLTREGFAFLDALHKQLVDPSVFIVPLRTSKPRLPRSQQPTPSTEAPQERRSRLNVMRASLAEAKDNATLAGLVAEFGTLTDKTAGRKLTKDGMAFLEGVADRLLVVRV